MKEKKKLPRLGREKKLSHWSAQSEDASLQVPPFLGGDLQSSGVLLPPLTSVKWLQEQQCKYRGEGSWWSGGAEPQQW